VCQELGIGKCNGKQLLRAVTQFGFSLEEVDSAIAAAQKNLSDVASGGQTSGELNRVPEAPADL
jgi:Domain of unknown function (DUF4093)